MSMNSNTGPNGDTSHITSLPHACRESPSSSIITIFKSGDLVLRLSHQPSVSRVVPAFRVDSTILKERSKYFARLLDGRFEEREQISKVHSALKERYGNVVERYPADELPILNIEDIGRISTVKSIEPLCRDFFCILHDLELQTSPPVANLANLAIVADRFDALEAMRMYMRRKKIIHAIDAKTTQKADNALGEERVRQRLLVGVLLDYGVWLEKYSQRAIIRGWTSTQTVETSALWWDLPSRLEEELDVRRQGILEAIQSLQGHFVKQYTSRERQCRLGYDSSAQCDIFQLGQAIRFFDRIGTLQVQGTIVETEPADPFEGDIHSLIDSLRQCPEYQVDSHHRHCGVRTKLLPLLELITEALPHLGVCAECWYEGRADNWLEAKQPLMWRRSTFRVRGMRHRELHANMRALFHAVDRDWND